MKRYSYNIAVLTALIILLGSGCGYFNTFYNARKQFGEAERDTRSAEKQAQRQQQQPTPQSAPGAPGQAAPPPPGGAPVTPGVASDKYRKVIETSSRLLEEHPKSRWADDALFIMGVSYFRLGDMPRAERKFTELITLFPNSAYVSDATIWKARTLAQQKKSEDAIELLQSGISLMKAGQEKASALFLMGKLCYDLKRYSDAAEYFKESEGMGQSRAGRVDARYQYGLAQFAQGEFAEARDAFADVASSSRDTRQAYDAAIRYSQCEVELKNYEKAEGILQELKSGERFLDLADDVDLELAQLAVRTGRVEDGVRLYQQFIDSHTNGERRGLAFYRLALIQRDQKADLTQAKSLLDSTGRSGASRPIADSARAALDQISKGLIVLEKIKSLQGDIRTLEAQLDSTGVSAEALTVSALLAHEDSIRQRDAAQRHTRVRESAKAEKAAADTTLMVANTPLKTDSAKHAVSAPARPAPASPAIKDSKQHGRSSVAQERSQAKSPGAKSEQSLRLPLADRTLSMLDSNQTWDMARLAFRGLNDEEKIGLQNLTRAIEERDSALGAGATDHAIKLQTLINRVYGVGTVGDSAGARIKTVPQPSGAPQPSRPDSVRAGQPPQSGSQEVQTPSSTQSSQDSTARPVVPENPSQEHGRGGLRGYRSSSESPGGQNPDSLGRPMQQDSLPKGMPLPPQPILPPPSSPVMPPSRADTSSRNAVPVPVPGDTVRPDTIRHIEATPRPQPADTNAAAPSPLDGDPRRTQLLARRRELQLAYLHSAEFYAYTLSERDSALNYYRMAASSPVNADVYWRANLYLGDALVAKADSVSKLEALNFYRAVVDADSVPVDAANHARAALQMPLVEVLAPPQIDALHAAERAQLIAPAPVDSVIDLYSRVVAIDSTSKEGKLALFAKAMLLEKRLHQYDQAKIVYERLLALKPDTAMATIARAKVAQPDTTSIFNLSDAELSGKHEAVEALLEAKQDESGWPPTEESLRGRHFH